MFCVSINRTFPSFLPCLPAVVSVSDRVARFRQGARELEQPPLARSQRRLPESDRPPAHVHLHLRDGRLRVEAQRQERHSG